MDVKLTLNGISTVIFGLTKKHADQHEIIVKAIDKIANWQHCQFHDGFVESVDNFARQQALNTDHIATHEKRLDDGAKDFDDIKKSIASLDKSYAVLAEQAKHRREKFKDKDKDES
jgi:hypothetical protein